MVIVSGNGVQYARSVNDLKKVPCSAKSAVSSVLNSDEDCESDVQPGETEADQEEDCSQTRSGLRRREIRKPARFNDDFIYRIFQ